MITRKSMEQSYQIQKKVARRQLARAKELRGTSQYRSAMKRASYEMALLVQQAVYLNYIRYPKHWS